MSSRHKCHHYGVALCSTYLWSIFAGEAKKVILSRLGCNQEILRSRNNALAGLHNPANLNSFAWQFLVILTTSAFFTSCQSLLKGRRDSLQRHKNKCPSIDMMTNDISAKDKILLCSALSWLRYFHLTGLVPKASLTNFFINEIHLFDDDRLSPSSHYTITSIRSAQAVLSQSCIFLFPLTEFLWSRHRPDDRMKYFRSSDEIFFKIPKYLVKSGFKSPVLSSNTLL